MSLAEKGEALPLGRHRTRFVDLPVSATEDRVVGTLDIEKAIQKGERRFEPGVLAAANRGVLYVDEVNLLDDHVVDLLLDVAASGVNVVEREGISFAHPARFVLIGSMNPEEGRLRPQILDRFGLRVVVRGLEEQTDRMEAYRRSVSYRASPRLLAQEYADETLAAAEEIAQARAALPGTTISPTAETLGLRLIKEMGIESLRAEITLFEAARAHAVADGRSQAEEHDIRQVAPMALRMRRSQFMVDYLGEQQQEDDELSQLIQPRPTRPKPGAKPRTSSARRRSPA